jgi:hypothetical protein
MRILVFVPLVLVTIPVPNLDAYMNMRVRHINHLDILASLPLLLYPHNATWVADLGIRLNLHGGGVHHIL